MKKLVLSLLTLSLGISTAAFADPPRTPRADRRQLAQQSRVVNGVRSCELTRREAVQRAAAAGVCEPRLLSGEGATVALHVCATVTASLAERPEMERRTDAVRTLRQALGYCWSVAVAAAPDQGLPTFLALSQSPDPDVAWIVRENLKKKRLQKALP